MQPLIYHNPGCGTSRNTLAMIKASGETPEVIEYLKTPPSRERLVALLAMMRVCDVMGLPLRTGERVRVMLVNDTMMAHPILINRPIVVTDNGARLCRPSERVLDLLERPVEHFSKER